MTSEHRCSHRLSVHLELFVIHQDGRSTHAHSVNTSLDGLYMAGAFSGTKKNTYVEVHVPFKDRLFLIHALVVHAKHNGIGLLFLRPQPELIQSILEVSSPHQTIQHYPKRLGNKSRPAAIRALSQSDIPYRCKQLTSQCD